MKDGDYIKYSIIGNTSVELSADIVYTINNYNLWRLITSFTESNDLNAAEEFFNFEVWLDLEIDKTNLFNELKKFVTNSKYSISWHECTHDEKIHTSCVITEIFHGA